MWLSECWWLLTVYIDCSLFIIDFFTVIGRAATSHDPTQPKERADISSNSKDMGSVGTGALFRTQKAKNKLKTDLRNFRILGLSPHDSPCVPIHPLGLTPPSNRPSRCQLEPPRTLLVAPGTKQPPPHQSSLRGIGPLSGWVYLAATFRDLPAMHLGCNDPENLACPQCAPAYKEPCVGTSAALVCG